MSNVIYPKGKESFALGNIDWVSDTIRIVLVDLGSYTYSAGHDALDDIPGGARVATSGPLAGKSATDGLLDADDVEIANVTGASVEAAVVFKDSGSEGTSWLIGYQPAPTSGFPLTPNGSSVLIEFPGGVAQL